MFMSDKNNGVSHCFEVLPGGPRLYPVSSAPLAAAPVAAPPVAAAP